MVEGPLVECRVAFKRGSKGSRTPRVNFAEALAARLRLVTPWVAQAASPEIIALNDSNFRVWTEAVLQGAEHRPEFLVEIFPQIGIWYFDPFANVLTSAFVKAVWAEAARLDEIHQGAGFRTVTVITHFPAPALLAVDVDSGRIVAAANTAIEVGLVFSSADPIIQRVVGSLPR